MSGDTFGQTLPPYDDTMMTLLVRPSLPGEGVTWYLDDP